MEISKSDIKKMRQFCDGIDQMIDDAVADGVPRSLATEIVFEDRDEAYQAYTNFRQAERDAEHNVRLRKQNEATSVEEYNQA